MTLKITVTSLFSLILLAGCGGSGSGDVTGDTFGGSSTPVNPTTTADNTPTTGEQEAVEINTGADELNLQLGDAGLCTPEGINAWVDAQMRDYYIFADQVPVVDPSEYPNPSALLTDLRVAPDTFSSISPQATRTALSLIHI